MSASQTANHLSGLSRISWAETRKATKKNAMRPLTVRQLKKVNKRGEEVKRRTVSLLTHSQRKGRQDVEQHHKRQKTTGRGSGYGMGNVVCLVKDRKVSQKNQRVGSEQGLFEKR